MVQADIDADAAQAEAATGIGTDSRTLVEPLVARVATTVDGAVALQQHLAEQVDDLRADVADVRRAVSAIARALADRPSATSGDVLAVHGHLDELRRDLLAARLPRPRPDGADGSGAVVEELDDVWAAVDALARLVLQAVRSLHTIEQSTVGLSPSAERERSEVEADLAALRAARSRGASPSSG